MQFRLQFATQLDSRNRLMGSTGSQLFRSIFSCVDGTYHARARISCKYPVVRCKDVGCRRAKGDPQSDVS